MEGGPPEVVAEPLWQELSTRLPANPKAVMHIVEFADFECPACGAYSPLLEKFMTENAGSVRFAFAHFPLSYHKFAMPSARAYECARTQGMADSMRIVLMRRQDNFGLRSWTSLASEAGVTDTVAFVGCIGREDAVPAVDADTALVNRIGIRATPGVVINGMYWPVSPKRPQLDSILRTALQKKRE